MNKPFFFVAAVSILLFTYLTLNSAANWLEMQPTPPDQKFAVVDTYKGCDVVRWNYSQFAEYKYFLNCKK